MPIRSNKGTADGPAPWFGIQRAGIVDFTDESSKYDWADVYLRIKLNVEGSKFERVLKLNGSFERDAEQNITDCTLLRRINGLAEALGWEGGVNAKGEWVNRNDEPITDISSYLTGKFGSTPLDDPSYNFLVYIYPKPGKDGKTYNEVHPRIMKNIPGNATELQRYINYMKTNGFLKEAKLDQMPDATNGAMTPGNASDEFTLDAL